MPARMHSYIDKASLFENVLEHVQLLQQCLFVRLGLFVYIVNGCHDFLIQASLVSLKAILSLKGFLSESALQ